MPVPGREIEPELQSRLAAGLGQLADDVALAAFVGAVLDRMLRVLAGPQTEAIVMLGREDDHFHPGVFARLDPLAHVELGRVEDRRVFRALAPLFVREGVHRVVDERDEFQLLPGKLRRRRPNIGGPLDQRLGRIARRGRGRIHGVIDADIVHDELVGQPGLLDVPAPLADLLGQLGEFRDLGHPAPARPPRLLAIDVEHILLGRPVQAEGVEAFAQAGKIELRAHGLMLFAIAVPVQVLGGAVLAPGLFHDVDLGAVASVVADLAHAAGHKPESGPVPLLLGEFAPADPVAVAMLEFALGADGPARVPVAVLLRPQDQMALAVEIGILLDPEPVPAFPVAEQLPTWIDPRRCLQTRRSRQASTSCLRPAAGGTPDPQPVRPGRISESSDKQTTRQQRRRVNPAA